MPSMNVIADVSTVSGSVGARMRHSGRPAGAGVPWAGEGSHGEARRSSSAEVEPRGLEGLRLTRRGRVVVWLLALFVAAGGVIGGARAFATEPSAPTRTDVVTVAPGQSLWEFASAVARPGEDVRDAVDRIMELNGLRTADLQVGQRLDLPIDD